MARRSLLLALVLVGPRPVAAQSALSPLAGPRSALPAALAPPVWADPAHRLELPQEPSTVSPWLATGSSLVIPGMGQLLLGQKRWTAYAGVELAGWIVH